MGPDYSVIIISEIIFHLDWATENVTQVGPLKIQSQLFWKFLQQKCRKFCLKMWQKRIYTHHEFPFLACAKKLSCGLKRKCWLGKMLYRKRAYIKNSFGKVNTIQWYDRFGNWRRKKLTKNDHLSSNDVQSKAQKLKLLWSAKAAIPFDNFTTNIIQDRVFIQKRN